MEEKVIVPMNKYCITLHKMKVNRRVILKDDVKINKNLLNGCETNEVLNKNNFFEIEDI